MGKLIFIYTLVGLYYSFIGTGGIPVQFSLYLGDCQEVRLKGFSGHSSEVSSGYRPQSAKHVHRTAADCER